VVSKANTSAIEMRRESRLLRPHISTGHKAHNLQNTRSRSNTDRQAKQLGRFFFDGGVLTMVEKGDKGLDETPPSSFEDALPGRGTAPATTATEPTVEDLDSDDDRSEE
jgi:hypothetical protein